MNWMKGFDLRCSAVRSASGAQRRLSEMVPPSACACPQASAPTPLLHSWVTSEAYSQKGSNALPFGAYVRVAPQVVHCSDDCMQSGSDWNKASRCCRCVGHTLLCSLRQSASVVRVLLMRVGV